MKNLLMIALALVTMNISAQEDNKDAQKAEIKERMTLRHQMTPEEIATLQTKRMTLHLDLTENQQAEVKKLLLEEATARQEKMKEKIASHKTMKESGEKPSKEERLKRENAKLDHQIEMKKKMKAILNDDQYAKYEEMHAKRDGKKRMMRNKGMSKQAKEKTKE